MDNITVSQIIGIITSITIIAGFFGGIFVWYKKNITDKFNSADKKIEDVNDKIDKEITTVNNRLENVETFVERKQLQYEKEMRESKKERMILLRGELSALKSLEKIGDSKAVSKSINEIEEYMMKKVHDQNTLDKEI